MTFKNTWVHKHSFQNTIQKRGKMVLDIPKQVEGVDKVKEDEEKTDLKENVEAASTCQPVD